MKCVYIILKVAPKGCPTAFSIQGSHDNIQFNILQKIDISGIKHPVNRCILSEFYKFYVR